MAEFEAIKGYLAAAGCWRTEFEPKVRELVELRDARAAAVERARATPTVEGSTGQVRENPAWQTALRLQAACDRLSAELLLTPRAASRAGVRLPGLRDSVSELDPGWSEIYGENPFDALAARRHGEG